MRKLFNLKKWLTIADAARHLAIVFGEDVTEADVLRLGLDGRLMLSVYFVNHARARCGKVVYLDEIDWRLCPSLKGSGMRLQTTGEHCLDQENVWQAPAKLVALLKDVPVAEWPNWVALPSGLNIDGQRFLELSDSVTTLRGVWDLPMVGNERLDIEHEYQNLTGGPAVTLQGIDGAFVEGRDGQMCQLQEDFDENEFQAGSIASLEKLKRHIVEKGIEGAKAESLLNRHNEKRKEFLEWRSTRPSKDNYYPASGLPKDSVLVVRTDALREFERQGDDAPLPTSRAHVSDKLAILNQAAEKFWANADQDDRTTHEPNAKVVAWLIERGYSETLAKKAATIIRPQWAPTGRKPEE